MLDTLIPAGPRAPLSSTTRTHSPSTAKSHFETPAASSVKICGAGDGVVPARCCHQRGTPLAGSVRSQREPILDSAHLFKLVSWVWLGSKIMARRANLQQPSSPSPLVRSRTTCARHPNAANSRLGLYSSNPAFILLSRNPSMTAVLGLTPTGLRDPLRRPKKLSWTTTSRRSTISGAGSGRRRIGGSGKHFLGRCCRISPYHFAPPGTQTVKFGACASHCPANAGPHCRPMWA
ncbi:hypothetical protein SAMN05444745_12057 [Arthrobacter sp. OV608]|nr:hypothetical protein SAMN05444745_12057 [Arthrobacter sp. OV608]